MNNPDNKVRDQVIHYLGQCPDFCLCKNYVAPVMCKDLFKSTIIYLISGLTLFDGRINDLSAQDFLLSTNQINITIPGEITASKKSDYIVFNSQLSIDCFRKQYGNVYDSKIYYKPINTSICSILNTPLKIPDYSNKQYDLLICCSHLDRKIKNNEFLINILTLKQFDSYKKCIIGSNNEKFKIIIQ
jgi:hypothetical protein